MRPKPIDIYSKTRDENTGLLVCLHGFTESPKKMLSYTGFDEDFATRINCDLTFLGASFYWNRYSQESRDTEYIFQEIKNFTPNKNRIYIAGFSAGACLVNTLVRYYFLFSKVISYAGLINDNSVISGIRQTKVLVLNNRNDKLVPMDTAYKIRNLYKASGVNVSMGVGEGSKRLGHWWDQKLNPTIERFLQ